MNDLLGPVSYPELGALLRQRTEKILRRWETQVTELLPKASRLTRAALRNTVPLILEEMANTLQYLGPTGAPHLSKVADTHGTIRHGEGFDLEEIFCEYRLMRRIVIEEVHDALSGEGAAEKAIALNMCFDAILQQAIVRFADAKEAQVTAETNRDAKYLSFLSHDIKNRLNHLTLLLQVVSKKLHLEDERALIDSAKRSVADTVEGMDKVLQAERAGKREEPRRTEEVHLRELVWKVAADLAPFAKGKALDIMVDIPAGAIVYSDSQLVSICLINLIENAVKYSDRGAIRVEAARSSEDNKSGWVVSVADEGPGIAEETLSKLFDLFSRGETHGQTGMGLGLAITGHTAKLLGTEIKLESKVGVGSTFRFFLPDV